jgi:hypothetical protein
MANPPSPTWQLRCPWCDWLLIVGARGARGRDPGAGVEAAERATQHAAEVHDKTWQEFLRAEASAPE